MSCSKNRKKVLEAHGHLEILQSNDDSVLMKVRWTTDCLPQKKPRQRYDEIDIQSEMFKPEFSQNPQLFYSRNNNDILAIKLNVVRWLSPPASSSILFKFFIILAPNDQIITVARDLIMSVSLLDVNGQQIHKQDQIRVQRQQLKSQMLISFNDDKNTWEYCHGAFGTELIFEITLKNVNEPTNGIESTAGNGNGICAASSETHEEGDDNSSENCPTTPSPLASKRPVIVCATAKSSAKGQNQPPKWQESLERKFSVSSNENTVPKAQTTTSLANNGGNSLEPGTGSNCCEMTSQAGPSTSTPYSSPCSNFASNNFCQPGPSGLKRCQYPSKVESFTPPCKKPRQFNETMAKMYHERQFCDTVLIIEGREFHCHKAVLSSASEFFNDLWTNGRNTSRFVMDDFVAFDANTASHLFRFIYEDDIFVSNLEALLKLMAAAYQFKMENLKERIREELLMKIRPENAISLFKFGAKYKDQGVLEMVISFVQRNKESVMQSEEFQSFAGDELKLFTLMMMRFF